MNARERAPLGRGAQDLDVAWRIRQEWWRIAGSALSLRKQRSLSANGRHCRHSTMKMFAHLSPTVPAIFVAAMGITLSVFLLHGAWVQGEPTPLLAAVGGTAGRVVADLPATVDHRASKPVREVASSAEFAATPSEHFVPATATSSDQRAPGTPPRTDWSRAARAHCCSASGFADRARHAGHDDPVVRRFDEGSGQGARPRPRPWAEVDRRSAGAPVRTDTERRSGTRASTTTDAHADTRSRRRPRHCLRPLRLRRCMAVGTGTKGARNRARRQRPSAARRGSSASGAPARGRRLDVWRARSQARAEQRRPSAHPGPELGCCGVREAPRRRRDAPPSDSHAPDGSRARSLRVTSVRSGESSKRTRGSSSVRGRLGCRTKKRASTSSAVEGRSGESLSSPRSVRRSPGAIGGEAHLPGGRSWFPTRPSAHSRGRVLGASTRAQPRERQPTFGCRGSSTGRSHNPSERGDLRRL